MSSRPLAPGPSPSDDDAGGSGYATPMNPGEGASGPRARTATTATPRRARHHDSTTFSPSTTTPSTAYLDRAAAFAERVQSDLSAAVATDPIYHALASSPALDPSHAACRARELMEELVRAEMEGRPWPDAGGDVDAAAAVMRGDDDGRRAAAAAAEAATTTSRGGGGGGGFGSAASTPATSTPATSTPATATTLPRSRLFDSRGFKIPDEEDAEARDARAAENAALGPLSALNENASRDAPPATSDALVSIATASPLRVGLDSAKRANERSLRDELRATRRELERLRTRAGAETTRADAAEAKLSRAGDAGRVAARDAKRLSAALEKSERERKARPVHWSPYDRVRVVNADP